MLGSSLLIMNQILATAYAFCMGLPLTLGIIPAARAGAPTHTVRIDSGVGDLKLFLRRQPAARASDAPPVLILHGATFPSANAAAWRIDGRSWMDELADAGFDVWALDFLGYGESDRYPEMQLDAEHGEPLGDVDAMVRQLERAIEWITAERAVTRAHLIAHSAGTFVAARYAERHPSRIERLVLFGAPAPATGPRSAPAEMQRHLQVSAADQLAAFEDEVRAAGRLDMKMFEQWSRAYLASDTGSGQRSPPSVRVPAGMSVAVSDMRRTGRLPYDPTRLRRPTLIIQGEWDRVSPPAEGAWLFDRLGAPLKRLVILSRGGHRLHLEASRFQLYREIESFLRGQDEDVPQKSSSRTYSP